MSSSPRFSGSPLSFSPPPSSHSEGRSDSQVDLKESPPSFFFDQEESLTTFDLASLFPQAERGGSSFSLPVSEKLHQALSDAESRDLPPLQRDEVKNVRTILHRDFALRSKRSDASGYPLQKKISVSALLNELKALLANHFPGQQIDFELIGGAALSFLQSREYLCRALHLTREESVQVLSKADAKEFCQFNDLDIRVWIRQALSAGQASIVLKSIRTTLIVGVTKVLFEKPEPSDYRFVRDSFFKKLKEVTPDLSQGNAFLVATLESAEPDGHDIEIKICCSLSRPALFTRDALAVGINSLLSEEPSDFLPVKSYLRDYPAKLPLLDGAFKQLRVEGAEIDFPGMVTCFGLIARGYRSCEASLPSELFAHHIARVDVESFRSRIEQQMFNHPMRSREECFSFFFALISELFKQKVLSEEKAEAFYTCLIDLLEEKNWTGKGSSLSVAHLILSGSLEKSRKLYVWMQLALLLRYVALGEMKRGDELKVKQTWHKGKVFLELYHPVKPNSCLLFPLDFPEALESLKEGSVAPETRDLLLRFFPLEELFALRRENRKESFCRCVEGGMAANTLMEELAALAEQTHEPLLHYLHLCYSIVLGQGGKDLQEEPLFLLAKAVKIAPLFSDEQNSLFLEELCQEISLKYPKKISLLRHWHQMLCRDTHNELPSPRTLKEMTVFLVQSLLDKCNRKEFDEALALISLLSQGSIDGDLLDSFRGPALEVLESSCSLDQAPLVKVMIRFFKIHHLRGEAAPARWAALCLCYLQSALERGLCEEAYFWVAAYLQRKEVAIESLTPFLLQLFQRRAPLDQSMLALLVKRKFSREVLIEAQRCYLLSLPSAVQASTLLGDHQLLPVDLSLEERAKIVVPVVREIVDYDLQVAWQIMQKYPEELGLREQEALCCEILDHCLTSRLQSQQKVRKWVWLRLCSAISSVAQEREIESSSLQKIAQVTTKLFSKGAKDLWTRDVTNDKDQAIKKITRLILLLSQQGRIAEGESLLDTQGIQEMIADAKFKERSALCLVFLFLGSLQPERVQLERALTLLTKVIERDSVLQEEQRLKVQRACSFLITQLLTQQRVAEAYRVLCLVEDEMHPSIAQWPAARFAVIEALLQEGKERELVLDLLDRTLESLPDSEKIVVSYISQWFQGELSPKLFYRGLALLQKIACSTQKSSLLAAEPLIALARDLCNRALFRYPFSKKEDAEALTSLFFELNLNDKALWKELGRQLSSSSYLPLYEEFFREVMKRENLICDRSLLRDFYSARIEHLADRPKRYKAELQQLANEGALLWEKGALFSLEEESEQKALCIETRVQLVRGLFAAGQSERALAFSSKEKSKAFSFARSTDTEEVKRLFASWSYSLFEYHFSQGKENWIEAFSYLEEIARDFSLSLTGPMKKTFPVIAQFLAGDFVSAKWQDAIDKAPLDSFLTLYEKLDQGKDASYAEYRTLMVSLLCNKLCRHFSTEREQEAGLLERVVSLLKRKELLPFFSRRDLPATKAMRLLLQDVVLYCQLKPKESTAIALAACENAAIWTKVFSFATPEEYFKKKVLRELLLGSLCEAGLPIRAAQLYLQQGLPRYLDLFSKQKVDDLEVEISSRVAMERLLVQSLIFSTEKMEEAARLAVLILQKFTEDYPREIRRHEEASGMIFGQLLSVFFLQDPLPLDSPNVHDLFPCLISNFNASFVGIERMVLRLLGIHHPSMLTIQDMIIERLLVDYAKNKDSTVIKAAIEHELTMLKQSYCAEFKLLYFLPKSLDKAQLIGDQEFYKYLLAIVYSYLEVSISSNSKGRDLQFDYLQAVLFFTFGSALNDFKYRKEEDVFVEKAAAVLLQQIQAANARYRSIVIETLTSPSSRAVFLENESRKALVLLQIEELTRQIEKQPNDLFIGKICWSLASFVFQKMQMETQCGFVLDGQIARSSYQLMEKLYSWYRAPETRSLLSVEKKPFDFTSLGEVLPFDFFSSFDDEREKFLLLELETSHRMPFLLLISESHRSFMAKIVIEELKKRKDAAVSTPVSYLELARNVKDFFPYLGQSFVEIWGDFLEKLTHRSVTPSDPKKELRLLEEVFSAAMTLSENSQNTIRSNAATTAQISQQIASLQMAVLLGNLLFLAHDLEKMGLSPKQANIDENQLQFLRHVILQTGFVIERWMSLFVSSSSPGGFRAFADVNTVFNLYAEWVGRLCADDRLDLSLKEEYQERRKEIEKSLNSCRMRFSGQIVGSFSFYGI